MISIYCDEDVDILIKPLLEAKGFKVLTTQDEKMLGSSDWHQLEHALKKGSVFLTHNRIHYEQLYAELISIRACKKNISCSVKTHKRKRKKPIFLCLN